MEVANPKFEFQLDTSRNDLPTLHRANTIAVGHLRDVYILAGFNKPLKPQLKRRL